jgi:hypothetical protein
MKRFNMKALRPTLKVVEIWMCLQATSFSASKDTKVNPE